MGRTRARGQFENDDLQGRPADEDIVEQHFRRFSVQGERVKTNVSDLPHEGLIHSPCGAISQCGMQDIFRYPQIGVQHHACSARELGDDSFGL